MINDMSKETLVYIRNQRRGSIDEIVPTDTPTVDFSECNSLDEIVDKLDWLNEHGYHIADREGVVYYTGKISGDLSKLRVPETSRLFTANDFPEPFNLRETINALLRKPNGSF